MNKFNKQLIQAELAITDATINHIEEYVKDTSLDTAYKAKLKWLLVQHLIDNLADYQKG